MDKIKKVKKSENKHPKNGQLRRDGFVNSDFTHITFENGTRPIV